MLQHLLGVAIVGSLALVGSHAEEADASKNFNRTIKSLYAFEPHTLTDEQTTAKSKELDKFWEGVKSNPTRYLPLLRQNLADAANPSFFFYDGSKLLLSLSGERQDQLLALSAIARSDLRDIQHDDYLFTVFSLAHLGLDTSEAAFGILKEPQFRVFIPQHALTLGQDFALIFMLLPTSEEFYLDKAIARLSQERDPAAQKSLLRLLWYSATEAGDRAIAGAANSEHCLPEVRELATDLSAKTENLERESKPPKKLRQAVADFVPKGADVAQIKEIRRNRLSRVSDEALYELDYLTMLIRIKGKRVR